MSHTDPPLDALCRIVARLGSGTSVIYSPDNGGKRETDQGFRIHVPQPDGRILKSPWKLSPGKLIEAISEMRST